MRLPSTFRNSWPASRGGRPGRGGDQVAVDGGLVDRNIGIAPPAATTSGPQAG